MNRIELIVGDPTNLRALQDSPEAFRRATGYELADELTEFPEAISWAALHLEKNADEAGWWTHLFVLRDEKRVIGMGGFKGPPVAKAVEIGYEIAPAYRGQGFAKEAARFLIERARRDERVELIRGMTWPKASASTAVLEHCGFQFAGPKRDEEDGEVWLWELRVRP